MFFFFKCPALPVIQIHPSVGLREKKRRRLTKEQISRSQTIALCFETTDCKKGRNKSVLCYESRSGEKTLGTNVTNFKFETQVLVFCLHSTFSTRKFQDSNSVILWKVSTVLLVILNGLSQSNQIALILKIFRCRLIFFFRKSYSPV